MTTAQARDWMKDLMADAAWTRRLAGALLGDPDAAHDAQQEAWLRSRGRHDAGNRRGFIRTVIANSMRSERRSQLRRRTREQVGLAAAQSETAPSPEELLGRLEVQKTIAALVTSLAEPGRQMVLLAYYEELTSAEIGKATGVPAGTVRWRIKNALGELRTQLEKHYGERGRDWRLALLPLAPAGGAAPVAPGRPVLFASVAAMGIVAVLLAGAWRLRWIGAHDDRPIAVAPAADGVTTSDGVAVERRRRGGTGSAPPMLAAAVLAKDCPDEIAALDGALAQARTALDYYLPARTSFHAAAKEQANPAGALALSPIMHRWLDAHGAPAERRKIECQGDGCKVKVTEPWPAGAWATQAPDPAAEAALARVARAVELHGPSPDEEDGRKVAETWVWLRLRKRDGSASDAPAPPVPAVLLPSGGPTPRTFPAPRTEECRTAIAAREHDLDSLRTRAHKEILAPVLYEIEPNPNPALAMTLQPMIERVQKSLPPPDRDVALAVACRGLVCKLEPPPGGAIKAKSLMALFEDPELSARTRRRSLVTRNEWANGPLFITLVPGPTDSRSGQDVLRFFMNQGKREGVIDRCKEHAPGKGKLSVTMLLPADGEPNHDGVTGRISFRLGDSLAEAPFGRCIAEALGQRVASFPLPPDVTRAEATGTIEL